MIGRVVSGQSTQAPDTYLAFHCQKKKGTPSQACLEAWFSQGSYRTDLGKETTSNVIENQVWCGD